MGLAINEWMAEVKKLSDVELRVILAGIRALLIWKIFSDQYSWMGLETIQQLLINEIKNRG